MNSDLADACDTLEYNYAFTMSSQATAQLFAAWPAIDQTWTPETTCPYPAIAQLADLADPQCQLPSTMAYACPSQHIVYVFAPSATELIWNAASVELALLRFLHEQQPNTAISLALPLSVASSQPSHSNTTSDKSESEDGYFRSEKGKDHIMTILEMEDDAKEAADAFDINDEEAMKVPARTQPFWFPIRMGAVALLVMLVTTIGAGKIYREWAIGGRAAYPRVYSHRQMAE